MFSTRLPETLEPNDFTRLLLAKKAAGEKILDLTRSNPTQVGLSFAFLKENGCCHVIPEHYEPSAQGMQGTREAISRYYRDHHRSRVDCADLFLTAGTSEAYSFLLKLLSEPGDEVLIPAPSYPLFDFLATLEKVIPVRYPLKLNDHGYWRIDCKSLEMMISSLTRAIVVVNPNNPTGSFITGDELSRLNELCRRHDLALIVDEVFLDFCNPALAARNTPLSVVANSEVLTFTLSGFSKILALPQTKLSWIHVNGPHPLQQRAKARLEFVADTYLSVNSMIQQQAPFLLTCRGEIQQQILTRIQVNEDTLNKERDREYCRREGGWYAIIRLPDSISDEACCLELLEHQSLLVHPGFFYDFPEGNWIVVSLITPEPEFHHGLAILKTYLSSK